MAQGSEVYPNVHAGRTRALAVGAPSRMSGLPDVPTFKELGIMFDIPVFGFDLWAPGATPRAIANQITKALEQAVKDPDYIESSRRQLCAFQSSSTSLSRLRPSSGEKWNPFSNKRSRQGFSAGISLRRFATTRRPSVPVNSMPNARASRRAGSSSSRR